MPAIFGENFYACRKRIWAPTETTHTQHKKYHAICACWSKFPSVCVGTRVSTFRPPSLLPLVTCLLIASGGGTCTHHGEGGARGRARVPLTGTRSYERLSHAWWD